MSDMDLLAELGSLFQIRQQVSSDFMSRANVVACGVGYKIKGEQLTTTPSIVVSVERKLPASALPPGALIPPTIQNVPTDVVETGVIVAHSVSRTTAMRPARPGISIGIEFGSTGTLGCIVSRGGQQFILSNNHVLANLNRAQNGAPITQPGASDGGTLNEQIGTLADFVPLRFLSQSAPSGATPQSVPPSGLAAFFNSLLQALMAILSPQQKQTQAPPPPSELSANRVDAALALPLNPSLIDPSIVDIGSLPQGIIEPKLGMRVVKSGRTTAISEATITQIEATVDVRYDDRVARFAGQIITTPLSQPGDSGALVMDFSRNAVGMIFSGSSQVTVLNPITAILTALNAQLLTAPGGPPAPETG